LSPSFPFGRLKTDFGKQLQELSLQKIAEELHGFLLRRGFLRNDRNKV